MEKFDQVDASRKNWQRSTFHDKEKPSKGLLKLAKSSIKIHKTKTFRRHFSFGDLKAKKKIDFDDGSEEAGKFGPIMRKLGKFLFHDRGNSVKSESVSSEENQQPNADTYVSFQSDLDDDFYQMCSQEDFKMDENDS